MNRKTSQIVAYQNDISSIVNLQNAKYVASVLMVIFSIYHISITLKLDNNSCKYLLMDGHYLSNYDWQPNGCMIHNYTTKDCQRCFNYLKFLGGKNRIRFLGDIYLREFYHNLISHISGQDNFQKILELDTLSLSGIFLDIKEINSLNIKSFFQLSDSNFKRAKPYVVLSFGLEIFNNSLNVSTALKNFERLLIFVAKQIKYSSNSKFIWMLLEHSYNNYSPELYEYVTKCNSMTHELLSPLDVLIWQSNVKIFQQLSAVMQDFNDMSIRKTSTYWYTQIYLNLYCNDVMKFHDGTCCSNGEHMKNIQLATFAFFGIFGVISIYCSIFDRLCLNSMNRQDIRKNKPFILTHQRTGSDVLPLNTTIWISIYEVSYAMMRLGLILLYFFICDRTMFFMKENKAYTTISFLLPLGYVFIVGIFFSDTSQKCGILNRDITDEWKGWLQCVILIYHITGASKILPIYFIVRLCVSSYLFMTGYGHFTYFYNKGDVSFRRFLVIQFRLNFITLCLCLTMNRVYQLYYFVPLVSVSFTFIYLFSVVFPIKSDSLRARYLLLVMILKFIVLIGFISFLYNFDTLFNKIFFSSPLRSLFVISEENPNEWKFRWSLDRYSFVSGMLYGLIYHTMKQANLINDNNTLDIFSIRISCIMFGLGIVQIFVYVLFALIVPDKQTGNQFHPYLAFIPILGYVFIRNLFGSVRKRYSAFFAAIGRISLELYVSQYHIWLAADAHGVLVLLPGYPVLNLLMTTFIFFCVAHELHHITGILLPYIIPDSLRAFLRCVVILAVLLIIPIALYHLNPAQ